MPRRIEHPSARVGERLLGATIVVAPLAAGGFRLQVLPLLAALAIAAFLATLYGSHRAGRPLHAFVLLGALLLLAGFTAFQAIPLPASLLELLSPRAAELRGGGGPLSYEPGATWREAGKLLVYALVAVVAFERVRARKRSSRREGDVRAALGIVAYPIVIAGITAAGIAIVHRVLGIERLFGLIEARGGSTAKMLTTFVNPNHAAGFMGLAALTAVGLALDATERPRRIGLLAVAALFGGVSVLVLSRGGLVALFVGILIFAVVAYLERRTLAVDERSPISPAFVGTALLLPIVGVLWRAKDVLADFGLAGEKRSLGFEEKVAAVRDAVPMIEDHPWFGIGRGAYVSVYTAYKSSPLQLTFAFPENLAAQLASEWGVVVGAIALFGLVTAVVIRLRRVASFTALGALSGVAVIVVQNAVDFSLEMPGVAIPVVAILAGAGARIVQTKRVSVRRPSTAGLVAFAPTAAIVGVIVLAFRGGDLFDDLDRIAHVEPDVAQELLARHPSSALVAARAAYAAETADPPRLDDAIRLASRAMFLAPTYADGHLLAGRLLVRSGHRHQGFGELRRAWALAPSSRGAWIDHVIALARSADEVVRAIPRRDPELDIIDEHEASRAITQLMLRDRAHWADAVIEALGPVEDLDADALTTVALAATKTGSTGYALAVLSRRLADEPDDEAARIAKARLLIKDERIPEARAVLAAIRVDADNAKRVLPLVLRLALATKDYDEARRAVDELERHALPTLAESGRLAGMRADVERAAGSSAKALHALDDALARDTGNIPLRLKRAVILYESGRTAESRVDAEFVLRRAPNHAGAKRLVEAIATKGK